ncbi:MAG: S8 family serine peptidase, partial [Saprospiraceae bacterium]
MKHLIWLIIFLPLILTSQEKPQSYGVIIMTSSPIEQIVQQITQQRSISISYKHLGVHSNTYLLESTDDAAIYSLCQNNRNIIAYEYNYMLTPRVRPNDVRSFEQYYLDVIKVFETWDVTTGGKDFMNNDLVIGVIDDGFELTHVDLKENIYLNPDEIANDNIDNDGNGYIDDINGWNTRNKTGTQDVKSHGTNILGVLGAKGNNNIGVTGMNWNIKLLPVSTGNLVSNVIEGYEYLVNEKRLYRSSNGTKGANIVVSSYSGGLAKAFASNHPIWCSVYDKLGTEGILSVGATTNDA